MKRIAYCFLLLSVIPLPVYIVKHASEYTISIVPYLWVAGICFVLATFFNSFAQTKATENTQMFLATRKTMKWSGLLYGAIFVLVALFMSVFMIEDKIAGNTSARALAQGAGWLVMFVVGIPVIIATPVIIIYNLFVLFTDLFCFLCKHEGPQALGIFTKLENINILKAHPRLNFILEISGDLLFIGSFCCIFFFIFS